LNMADRQPVRQQEDTATWVNNSDSDASFSARLLICCLLY
jgi:hypothetical protein